MGQLVDVPNHGVVEFPDGMSDDEIKGAIKRNLSRAPAADATPQPPATAPAMVDAGSNGEPAPEWRRTVQIGIAKANKHLGNILWAPSDVMEWAVDKAIGAVGFEPPPHVTAHQIYDSMFVEPAGEPRNRAERISAAAGGMVGDTVPLLIGGAGALASRFSSTLGQAARPVATTLSGAFRNILDRMATSAVENPVRTIASEYLSAAGAGAGGQAAAESPLKDAIGEQGARSVGEIAGGFAAPYAQFLSPTRVATKVVTAAAPTVLRNVPAETGGAARAADQLAWANREGAYANPSVPRPEDPSGITGMLRRRVDAAEAERNAKTSNNVGSTLRALYADPTVKANVAQAEELQTKIPGFNPGLARTTNDPALLNLQRKVEGRAAGQELREVQSRTDASRQSIRDFMENAAPESGVANPDETVSKAARARIGGLQDKVEKSSEAVRSEIQKTSDELPTVDRIAGGEVIRTSREAAQRAMDAETTRLRGQIANPDRVVEITAATETKPAVTMTVNQVLNRRASINQQMRDYNDATARTADDVRAMRQLQAERDRLDEVINGINEPGMAEYTAHYREQNVPQFRQGASAEVARRDQFGYGGNRVDPEQVGRKFFNPNEESAARQFNTSMGHDPLARQQMIDNALDDIRHTAVDPTTGVLKEGAVAKWLKKNERVLNEVPFVRDAVNAKNPDALYARLGELEQRQQKIADSGLAKILNSNNPERHIDAALNDWQVMRGLKKSVKGDAPAEAALARAVWNRATAASGKDLLVDAAGLQQWIDGHRQALKQALSPKHLSDLETVIKAASIEGRLPRPIGTAEEASTVADKIARIGGVPIPGLLSRYINVASGRASSKTVGAEVGVRILRKFTNSQLEDVWKRALYDPKVADMLRNGVKAPGLTQTQYQRLHSYLLASPAVDVRDQLSD